MAQKPEPNTPTPSPAGRAMDRAIDLELASEPVPYPKPATFIDADEPYAGREIARALKNGNAVVLVSPDGQEHILTEQQPAT